MRFLNLVSVLVVLALSASLQVKACSSSFFSFFSGKNYDKTKTNTTKPGPTKVVEKEVIGNLLNGLLELGIELTPEFECPEEEGLFRDRFDCATYYKCVDWKFVLQKCQRDFGFDQTRLICVPREDANCDLGPLDTNYNCTGSGLEPNEDCTRFYICIGDKAFSQKCEEGKKFDKYFKICLDEKKASCFVP